MPLLIIIAAALLFLVDWQNAGAAMRAGVEKMGQTAERNLSTIRAAAPKPRMDGEAWCRSISHYEGQYRFCMDGVRDGGLLPPLIAP